MATQHVEYKAGDLDDEILDALCPEKRLLASVLQRAIVDLLSMKDKDQRILEISSGFFDLEDEMIGDKYRQVGTRGKKEGREARNLIRWFRSESKHPFSFLYIIEALGLETTKNRIFRVLKEESIKDHPTLSLQQI